jgi:hypothetical protein
VPVPHRIDVHCHVISPSFVDGQRSLLLIALADGATSRWEARAFPSTGASNDLQGFQQFLSCWLWAAGSRTALPHSRRQARPL